MAESTLARLAEAYGIAPSYYDIWGNLHPATEETITALLTAMGVRVTTLQEQERALMERERALHTRRLEPVHVAKASERPVGFTVRFPDDLAGETFHWSLEQEDGTRQKGEFIPRDLEVLASHEIEGRTHIAYRFQLPVEVPVGYHSFRIIGSRPGVAAGKAMTLLVTPDQCFEAPNLGWGKRIWGLEVQLYALKSGRNWGIGDFTDLADLIDVVGERGGGIVGLNPLHALYPHNPKHSSPYSPSSRSFLNPLYLDVTAIPEFDASEKARQMVADPSFQERLRLLRSKELVDYPGVLEVKFKILEVLFREFSANHLDRQTDRGREFLAYFQEKGVFLEYHALYDALQEHLWKQDPAHWGWPVWPEEFRQPNGRNVQDFLERHQDRVTFFAYLQWETHRQLAACQQRAADHAMNVGLYLDIAVGNDRGGSETWMFQEAHAMDASIGAPPDPFSPTGQNWGFPPMTPVGLRESAYMPFIQMLRTNMADAGAIRIDHILGLYRFFWIPRGQDATAGAYVHYPVRELFGILALESHRNRCMVVGEDMGTVPPAIREAMEEFGIYGIKVLYFEKREDGTFKSPGEYFWREATSASNHDLPTLRGFFEERDIDIWKEIGRFPDEEAYRQRRAERRNEKRQLLYALRDAGLLPGGIDPELPPTHLSIELHHAIQLYASRTESKIQLVQLEDIFGQRDQVNLPGTLDEHPNWCRKLPATVQDLRDSEAFGYLAADLSRERPR